MVSTPTRNSAFTSRRTLRPVVLLKGDLDLESAPALRACLVEFAEKNVTLDFSDVTFMDSTAMGVLLTGHQRSTLTGTRITIQGVQPGQLRLFELMGLLDQLNVYRDGPRDLDMTGRVRCVGTWTEIVPGIGECSLLLDCDAFLNFSMTSTRIASHTNVTTTPAQSHRVIPGRGRRASVK